MLLPVQPTRSEARKISLNWTIATPDKRDRYKAQANVSSARSLYYVSPRCPCLSQRLLILTYVSVISERVGDNFQQQRRQQHRQ